MAKRNNNRQTNKASNGLEKLRALLCFLACCAIPIMNTCTAPYLSFIVRFPSHPILLLRTEQSMMFELWTWKRCEHESCRKRKKNITCFYESVQLNARSCGSKHIAHIHTSITLLYTTIMNDRRFCHVSIYYYILHLCKAQALNISIRMDRIPAQSFSIWLCWPFNLS